MVKTVRASLIKPLDESWESVGRRLSDLRGCSHRLLNAGIRSCLRTQDQSGKGIAQAARDGVKQALADERAYWTSKIGKKYEGANLDTGRAERLAELALPSVIEDTLASRSAKAYADARKHMARGDKSIPSYSGGAPIFFRDGANAWEIRKGERGYEIALKIYPGRGPKTRFALGVHGPSAHADIAKMLRGEGIKLGDAKVVRNDRTRSWEVLLAYSFDRPSMASGTEIVAVHRGMHQFLTIASTTASVRSMPGAAYLHAKQMFHQRRRSIGGHLRKGELGHGARGHGRKRRFQAITHLDDREARMMRTACQQAAALVVKFARSPSIGAYRVLIEDYSTIRTDDTYIPKWPWAELKAAIVWACAKAGLELQEVPSEYISQTCPACEHVAACNVRGRFFECERCGFDWGIDSVAAFNMLRLGAPGTDVVRKMQEKLQRLATQSRQRKDHEHGIQAAE